MTTMTQPIPRFACRHHHPLTTAALVVLFWLASAVLVIAAHMELRSTAACATVTVAVLLLAAYGYTRVVAQQSGVTHGMAVGIAWLVFSILAEIALTARVGHGWFYLLGSPEQPLLRNIDLFVWIFAPALFARGAGNDAP